MPKTIQILGVYTEGQDPAQEQNVSVPLGDLVTASLNAGPFEVDESISPRDVYESLRWAAYMKFATLDFDHLGFHQCVGNAYAQEYSPAGNAWHHVNPHEPWQWTASGSVGAFFRVKEKGTNRVMNLVLWSD